MTTALFRLPEDASRCRTWVQNCGNRSLLLLPVNKIHMIRYLCLKHFEPQHFFDKYRRKLHRNAVPTIFSGSPIKAEEMAGFDRMDFDAGLVNSGKQSSPGIELFSGVVSSTPGSSNMHESQQGHLSHSHASGFAIDDSLTEGEYSLKLPPECFGKPVREAVSSTPGPSDIQKKLQGHLSASHLTGFAVLDASFTHGEDSQLPTESISVEQKEQELWSFGCYPCCDFLVLTSRDNFLIRM